MSQIRNGPYGWRTGPMQSALGALGIRLKVVEVPVGRCLERFARPAERLAVPLGCTLAWMDDFPSGSESFIPQFTGVTDEWNYNYSLLGVARKPLNDWGYSVTDVPSVDQRTDACLAQTGFAQIRCWAELDQYLMNELVPRIPLWQGVREAVVSDRVAAFSFDPSTHGISYDRISLVEGSE